jgi:ABC-2 type transport system permease protein
VTRLHGLGLDATGWPTLARLSLRTSRRRLLAWPVVVGFLVFVTAAQIPELYGTQEARAAYAATAGDSAATKAFNGRGYALDTIGGITAYELGFFTLLVFPVVALHLAIHLTRSQEAAGRFDLVAAGRLGRTAPLVSAVVVLSGVLGLMALLTLLALLVSDLGSGSVWYAAGLLLQLLAMAALGLLVAEIATDGQGAHGLGLATLGFLFGVRAVVDAGDLDATWLSPMGWIAEVRAFDDPQVWPLVAYALLTVALVAAAATINLRRDLGGGLVDPRPGPATGAEHLGTPAGLAARLTRGAWIGWTVGTVMWGFLIGLIAREMRTLVESNPEMQQVLGAEGADPEDLMVAAGGFFVALLALGFVVQAVGRLATEESTGRLGVVLASRVSRATWWLGAGATVLVGGVVTLLVSGLALGLGVWIGTGEAGGVATGLEIGTAFVSPLLLLGAVCLLLIAVSPRLAGACWAVFALVMTLDLLGEVLNLPGWVLDLSPYHQAGQPPIDPAPVLALVVMGLLAVLVGAASVLLFRRRDLAQ